jgi:hypothetical protein
MSGIRVKMPADTCVLGAPKISDKSFQIKDRESFGITGLRVTYIDQVKY